MMLRRAFVQAAPTCKLWMGSRQSGYFFLPGWAFLNWYKSRGTPKGVTVYWTHRRDDWFGRLMDAFTILPEELKA